jgi:hypothetical protein
MAAAIAASFLLDLSVTLVAAPATSNTILGALLTGDTLDGGGAGTYLPFTSSGDVAAALAASKIASGTAAALNVALGQDRKPSVIYVVTYASGDPYAGLTLAIESGLDVGAFVLTTTTESVLETCATAYAADSRRARMVMIAQSADTGLYGGSKPSSLDALEQSTIKLDYSVDTEYLAAARLGRLCGQDLTTGLPGATFRPLSVAPAALTNAQVVLLKANDSGCCLKQNYGAGASERITVGEKSYDGSSWSAAVACVYICRQLFAALLDVWARHAVSGIALQAGPLGMGEVAETAQKVLAPLKSANYFTPVAAAPAGYTITPGTASDAGGAYLTCDITVYISREAYRISVPVTGQEV